MDLVFTGRVIEWRGPSPFYFVPVPQEQSADIREVASQATHVRLGRHPLPRP
ncbi:uncharacterized protein DUF1905 [Streptomyces sp. TLI_235]|nr:uncharacterized protein DUF1905 [Streptomyces sp. TLI_235]